MVIVKSVKKIQYSLQLYLIFIDAQIVEQILDNTSMVV